MMIGLYDDTTCIYNELDIVVDIGTSHFCFYFSHFSSSNCCCDTYLFVIVIVAIETAPWYSHF